MEATALALKPLNDYLFVRQDPAKDRSAGGIFFPQGSEEYPVIGTVIATGPGTTDANGERVPLDVKVGDRVMFKRRPSSAIHPDSREYDTYGMKDVLRLQEKDLLAIVEGGES